MPYIKDHERVLVKPTVPVATTAGQLNYQLTIVAKEYWDNHTQNYQTIAEIKSAFQGALAEFDRIIVANYENQKIEANGGIW